MAINFPFSRFFAPFRGQISLMSFICSYPELRLFYFVLMSGLFLVSPNYLQAGHLPTKSYTTFDGLANDSVNKIVRDSRGFLWFCAGERSGGKPEIESSKLSGTTINLTVPLSVNSPDEN